MIVIQAFARSPESPLFLIWDRHPRTIAGLLASEPKPYSLGGWTDESYACCNWVSERF